VPRDTGQPGVAGQRLISPRLDKVRQLPQPRAERALARPLIAVDGGVHVETIVDMAATEGARA
jgi:pentose-5-phosphate-3-epimerase